MIKKISTNELSFRIEKQKTKTIVYNLRFKTQKIENYLHFSSKIKSKIKKNQNLKKLIIFLSNFFIVKLCFF